MSERAILVGVELRGPSRRAASATATTDGAEDSLEELAALTRSAGGSIVERVVQSRPRPEAATLLGAGKVEELAALVRALDADVVIFDRDLTPTQYRNLELAIHSKVIDRTQLILDIFARRARTREGQLQVELAQLNYLLPRLAGRGVMMSRLGGGIGTRGPGETQLETDRRRIFRRIQRIEGQLEAVRTHRSVQRRQRQSVPLAAIALVGYTNAGKSTLFNRLTGAGVFADAKMFATLDPTVRLLILPSKRRVLLGDTVGFIRNLPTTLIRAFRATLEEVTESAMLLHVVDASAGDAVHQAAHVFKVLAEIGAADIPQLLVMNKSDLLAEAGLDTETVCWRILAGSEQGRSTEGEGWPSPRVVAVCARTGEGVDGLLAAIDERLPIDPVSRATFRVPIADSSKIHWLHEFARVKTKRYKSRFCIVEAEVPESVKKRMSAYLISSESRG